MKGFKITPKEKPDRIRMKPISTRLPADRFEKLQKLAEKNGLSVLELAQQMLLHCLEVNDDET
jgi:hypothetical protein